MYASSSGEIRERCAWPKPRRRKPPLHAPRVTSASHARVPESPRSAPATRPETGRGSTVRADRCDHRGAAATGASRTGDARDSRGCGASEHGSSRGSESAVRTRSRGDPTGTACSSSLRRQRAPAVNAPRACRKSNVCDDVRCRRVASGALVCADLSAARPNRRSSARDASLTRRDHFAPSSGESGFGFHVFTNVRKRGSHVGSTSGFVVQYMETSYVSAATKTM